MTGKQTEFVKYYCTGETRNNGTQSAIKAGYSINGIRQRALELLTNIDIVSAIKAYRAKTERKLTHDRIQAIEWLHKALTIAIKQNNPTAITGAIRELNAISGLHTQTIINDTVQKRAMSEEDNRYYSGLAKEYGLKLSKGKKIG